MYMSPILCCPVCGNENYTVLTIDKLVCENCGVYFKGVPNNTVIYVNINLLDGANLPIKAYNTDSGFDLCAYEDIKLYKEIIKIRTGIMVELPPNMEIQIRARSGLSSQGIIITNGLGTIDNGYRGEILVPMYNLQTMHYPYKLIKKGDKIAQMVIKRIIPNIKFNIVHYLSNTERNDKGFGSTDI